MNNLYSLYSCVQFTSSYLVAFIKLNSRSMINYFSSLFLDYNYSYEYFNIFLEYLLYLDSCLKKFVDN